MKYFMFMVLACVGACGKDMRDYNEYGQGGPYDHVQVCRMGCVNADGSHERCKCSLHCPCFRKGSR